jgi:transposase InsO family protein
MKSWLTTSELAALALPGLPSTRQGWETLAERDGWADVAAKVRTRTGRGGGLEYHIDLLPPAALAALAARVVGKVSVADEDRLSAEAAPDADSITASAADHRDARLALLAAAERFASAGILSRVAADAAFCGLYNLGKIEVEAWVRQAVPELAPRSVRRWRALRASGKIGALAIDKGASRRGAGTLDKPDVRAWLLGYIAHKPHSSAQSALDYLGAQFPDLPKVHLRDMQRALKALKSTEKVALTRITNPDAWKSKYEPSGENSNAASRLNELWMIDASPADVLLINGRHSIYACIDRYSRRTIIYVTKTPRAEAVGLLLRQAILAWGVPERIKTDNGSDFKARRVIGLLGALEIEVEPAKPYSPKEKAHVERVIKSFQHDCASDLPGFIGHNVSDRKVIEERKSFAQRLGETDDNIFCVELDAKAFQEKCTHWAGVRYEHRAHGGRDMGGQSPFQKAAGYNGKIRRIEDLHALDMLLAPIAGGDGCRTTTKNGVRVANSDYYTPTVLPGERVFVRMDPADSGRIYLFTPDGLTYLGEGLCPQLSGVDPMKLLAETKRAQAALLAERTAPIRAELREIKKNKGDLAASIARREAEAAGKLTSLPRKAENYSTPALEAAADARAGQSRGPARDIEFVTPAPASSLVVLPETRRERFARALQLEELEKAGIALALDDARWLAGYRVSAEYLAAKMANQDFGTGAQAKAPKK